MLCCSGSKAAAEPTMVEAHKATNADTPACSEQLPVLLGSSKKVKQDETKGEPVQTAASSVLLSFPSGSSDEKTKKEEETCKPASTTSSSRLPSSLFGGSSDNQPRSGEATDKPVQTLSSPLMPSFLGGSSAGKQDEASKKDSTSNSSDSACENILGSVVKKVLASYDEHMLGVKVYTESMNLRPVTGSIEIHGLHVENPAGYKSPYMLRAKKLMVKVDMMKLMRSLGNTIVIKEVDIDDVDAIYEKSCLTSNINDLILKLEEGKKPRAGNESSKTVKDEPKITLHQIQISGIGAKICTSAWPGAGPRLAVADIAYEDFEKEIGGAAGVMDVIVLVTTTVLKSIMASIIGKEGMNNVLTICSCGHCGTQICGSLDAHEVTLR